MAAVLALPVASQAAENIILGTYTSGATPTFVSSTINLQPDLAGQTIKIYASGGSSVPGVNLNLTVQDGGQGSATLGPAIQDVDILTGTVFQNNNTGQTKDGPLFNGQFFQDTTDVTNPNVNNVTLGPGNVLLATVTISTAGIFSGSYSFAVDGKYQGNLVTDASDFADNGSGGTLTLGDATINITPEPASLGLLGLAIPALLLRRRSRQAASPA